MLCQKIVQILRLRNAIFFGNDSIVIYLSLDKESDNFCVVFTYSITRAREIRTFHVVAVATTVKKCTK